MAVQSEHEVYTQGGDIICLDTAGSCRQRCLEGSLQIAVKPLLKHPWLVGASKDVFVPLLTQLLARHRADLKVIMKVLPEV